MNRKPSTKSDSASASTSIFFFNFFCFIFLIFYFLFGFFWFSLRVTNSRDHLSAGVSPSISSSATGAESPLSVDAGICIGASGNDEYREADEDEWMVDVWTSEGWMKVGRG